VFLCVFVCCLFVLMCVCVCVCVCVCGALVSCLCSENVCIVDDDIMSNIPTHICDRFSPENPEVLTTVGLLYLRMGENFRAFEFLGNSLTHDNKNPKVSC